MGERDMMGIDFGFIGGLLLVAGAIAMYRGDVQWSIIYYFIADLCWLGLSLQVGNVAGSIMVGVGMALGIGVYLKMNRGIFVKNLKTEKEKDLKE